MIPFNWFDKTIYLPWQIGVPIVVAMVAAAGLIAYFILRRLAKKTFVCPDCAHRFNIKPRQLLTTHLGDAYLLKCPSCGKKSFCVEIYREKEENQA